MGVLVSSLTATFLDEFWSKKSSSEETSLSIELLSIKRNLKTLLAKRTSEALPCIHGIRVISMIWIIFGHSTDWLDYNIFSRAFRAKEELAQIHTQFLYNGWYSVETFFFLG